MPQGKVYDISLTIHPGMLVWPGNPQVALDTVKSIARGDSSNVSLLHIGTHTATHIDAPRHFIAGAPGTDAISPDILLGQARLFQLTKIEHIDRKLLEGLDLKGVTRLLLGTRNSAMLKQSQFEADFAFVADDAARYLVDIGVQLVGIDYLSIAKYKEGRPTHHILLEAGVVIVEGLDLTGVPAGNYELLCLPLKLKDGNGAPARVFLREL